MGTVDDPEFESFVNDMMNASFSTTLDMTIDSENDDILINNIFTDSESEEDQPPTTTESPADSQQIPAGPSHQQQTPPPLPATQQARPRTIHLPATQRPRPRITPTGNLWRDVTDIDPGYNTTIPIYNVTSGPNLPTIIDVDSKPIEFFDLFFNDDILSLICNETNLFAHKRQNQVLSPHARIKKWKDVTLVDMKAFLGLVINMGLMPLPSIESYFTTEWVGRIPFFREVFNKDEFLNIFWNLHFNHVREENVQVPKHFQIDPILTHMKKMSRLFYTPTECVSVDESTISFKGRVSFRVYNPMKPTKFGMKVFVISDSKNGYLYDFIPYFGGGSIISNSNLLKTTQIVKTLTESVVLKDPVNPTNGLHVFTDRYYTSPELAEELLKLGCFLTGTVMTNRTGMPPGLKAKGKKMKKGDLLAQRKGPSLVVSWKDKRPVHMLSTFSKGSRRDMTDVPCRWPNKPPTKKPNVVINYIKNMGGVDRSDHFISSYQFMRRTKKWYRKLFFWLFEVGLINAYLLYKQVQTTANEKPLSHRQFRMSLVKALVAEKVATRPQARKRGRQAQGPPEERLDGKPHFMSRREKGSRQCVVCTKNGLRRETIYYCKTCTAQPPLHPDSCFERYHTLSKY